MRRQPGSWRITGGEIWWTGSRKSAEAHRAATGGAVAAVHTGFDAGYAVLLDRPDDHLAQFSDAHGAPVDVDVRPWSVPERTSEHQGTTYLSRPVILTRRTVTRIRYPYITSGVGLTGWQYAGELYQTVHLELTVGIRPEGRPLQTEDLMLMRCPDARCASDAVGRRARLTGWVRVAEGRAAVDAYRTELGRTAPFDNEGLPAVGIVADTWCRDAALYLLRQADNDIAELSSSPSTGDWHAYDEFCETHRAPWLRATSPEQAAPR